MAVIGGQGYKWKGKNTRIVRRKGKDFLSMPRKDSVSTVPVSINPNSMYEITLMAVNNGGNGAVALEFFSPDIAGKPFQLYIKNKRPQIYSLQIPVDAASPDMLLRISRPAGASGNILIETISYEEIERPPNPPTPEDIYAIEREKEAKRKEEEARQLKKQQARAAREAKKLKRKNLDERDDEIEAILIARGERMGVPIKVGGIGYRWRGKNIRTGSNFGSTCVYMPSRESLIMIPVKIVPEARYRVTVLASRVDGSGNGNTMINMFGGQKFDGVHAQINVSSGKQQDYAVEITAPKFPNNIPMNLRLWRPGNGTGTVCIKEVTFVQIADAAPTVVPRSPKLNKVQPLKKSKNRRNQQQPRIVSKPPIAKIPQEDYEMKFRPYKLDVGREDVEKVLVNKPSKVPKVSIITPTRDGKHLLEGCYKALNENTAYPNWEWIIGDSESEDGTAEYIKGLKDPRIKFVERGTTEGSFSSINNELVKYSDGEYLLFLNNDTEPGQFWMYEMVSKIHRHEDIGIVGARLEYENGKTQHAGVAFIPQGPANLGKDSLGKFAPGFQDHDRFYQAVTAACLLIRRKDFDAVDGFDPVYYFCYEDIDLCLNVRYNLNKKVLYAANARVKHLESITQKKHRTSGDKQKKGIEIFKSRWMSRAEKDFTKYMRNPKRNIYNIDVSFVTCVNNITQYSNYIIGSLFMNNTKRNYEIIPVLNFGNTYSAAQALNLGISKARGDIIVMCHQDVIFYEDWVDMLYDRIDEVTRRGRDWGVLGTAGITTRDATVGVVHNLRGNMQWTSTRKHTVHPVQTVDEHCMVIRKDSNLRFDDETFDGFHFYGPDICLTALDKGMQNFGILCPLVHDSHSGSLISGKQEFMRLLNLLSNKWRKKFNVIRTPTSMVKRNRVRAFVKFKNR